MDNRTVHVAAPSRLHFGLLSFGGPGRQFGGVGAMIDEPGLELAISPFSRLATHGPLAGRAQIFARRWAAFQGLVGELNCRIEVTAAPRQHVGLGVGTQLGLSIAAGLNAFLGDRPLPSPGELALSVGRGLRSAVGTYGFAQGGLIAERGKLPQELFAPLDCRLALPADWRFVLICPRGPEGLSGAAERRAFAQLPPVPAPVTEGLVREIRERMLPAAAEGRFHEFSESVYRYGYEAGMCFARVQGGAYHGPRLKELVGLVRSLGVSGVGQSSWGPTLFAILPDQAQAETFVARLNERFAGGELEITASAPNNRGVHIQTGRKAAIRASLGGSGKSPADPS